MDGNKDGQLTRDELPADVRVYFSVIDTNKDDACSVDELIKAARKLAGAQ